MIQSFKNADTGDILNSEYTKPARRICPSSIWKIPARKLDQVDSFTALTELRIPPNKKLEALSGDRKGQTIFVSMTNWDLNFARQDENKVLQRMQPNFL